jgi:hypothetical protein
MAEQGYLPYSAIIHQRTEAWGPDSAFGHLLSYLLVILPLGWLVLKATFSTRPVLSKERAQTADHRGVELDPGAGVLGSQRQSLDHAR